jgi:MYXO-CTERM domain-containing protein
MAGTGGGAAGRGGTTGAGAGGATTGSGGAGGSGTGTTSDGCSCGVAEGPPPALLTYVLLIAGSRLRPRSRRRR